MKYHIIIFGCQMNHADAERIDTIMKSMGYEKTDAMKDADAIIVVACSVRQHAIDRIYGLKKSFDKARKVRPVRVILTGCVVEGDKKNMSEFFDDIIPITKIQDLPKMLGGLAPVDVKEYLSIAPKHTSEYQAFIPISRGCNLFCSYCVVPYTRGREVCRDYNEIIDECKHLISRGYKKITLLGQTVNSYKYKDVDFTELLRRIDSIPGDFWIYFLSSHPNFFTKELIGVWKKSKHMAPFLHLAAQSGDDEMLKKMNRKYDVKKFMGVVDMVRKAIPGITVSTDFIVGYPGETKKQFDNTSKLMKALHFDMAYISKYSQRKGTLGEKLHKDDILLEEKKNRHKILNDILKKTALAKNKKYIGNVVRVLVEGEKGEYWFGKTNTFKNIKIKHKKLQDDFIGKFVDAKIIRANAWGIFGEMVLARKKTAMQ